MMVQRNRRQTNSMCGWWCGVCGMPYDWRKPNRLLTLQIGHTANDQMIFLAYSALGGCDEMIVVLQLITNLVKGNNFEVEVKGLTESSKRPGTARKKFVRTPIGRIAV